MGANGISFSYHTYLCTPFLQGLGNFSIHSVEVDTVGFKTQLLGDDLQCLELEASQPEAFHQSVS